MSKTDPLILYVLMRTDVPDFQPGKAMAQSNHAGTLFARNCSLLDPIRHRSNLVHVHDWFDEGGGFGTCVVLEVTRRQMFEKMRQANLGGLLHGVVHDPSYPIRDGDTIQHLPVDTCAYVFGRKDRCEPVTGSLKLLRLDD